MLSATLNATTMGALEAAFDTFWVSVQGYVSSEYRLDQYRWYDVPATGDMGAAIRVTERDAPGTSGNDPLPSQVALAVTERTFERKRWGRFYLPGFHEGTNNGGRPSSTMRADIAQAAQVMLNTRPSTDVKPVVHSRGGLPDTSVTEIRIDDIWDIQRPRRIEGVLSREVLPVNP
jgi:hypothetical protein